MSCPQKKFPHQLLVLFLVTSVMGCNAGNPSINYSHLKLASVTGSVTLDNEPLAGATVKFEEADTGRFSFGVTDENGHYKAMFDSTKAGVTPGKKIIRVSMKPAGEQGDAEETEGEPETSSITIPEKYNKNSELTEEVDPNGSHQFNFELKSK